MTVSGVILITFYNWFNRQFNAIEVLILVKQSLRKSVGQVFKSVFVVFCIILLIILVTLSCLYMKYPGFWERNVDVHDKNVCMVMNCCILHCTYCSYSLWKVTDYSVRLWKIFDSPCKKWEQAVCLSTSLL